MLGAEFSTGIEVHHLSLFAWLAAIFFGFELSNRFKSPLFLTTPYVVIFVIALFGFSADVRGIGFLFGMIAFTLTIQWFGRD